MAAGLNPELPTNKHNRGKKKKEYADTGWTTLVGHLLNKVNLKRDQQIQLDPSKDAVLVCSES